MSRIGKGLLAGLSATVVLSALMMVLGWTYGKLLPSTPAAAMNGA